MKRQMVGVALASAAVLMLGACGGETSGQAQPADQTGSSSAQQTESVLESAETAGSAETSSGGSATGSAGAEDEAGQQTGSASSGTNSDGASESGSSDAGASDAPAASATGDAALDDQSAAWFTAACTSMKPVIDASMTMLSVAFAGALSGAGVSGVTQPSMSPEKLQQAKQAVMQAMKTAGAAMDDAADTLSSTPPPTIDNGQELAADAVTKLHASAQAADQAAEKLSHTTITDFAQFKTIISGVGDEANVGDLENPLLGSLMGQPSGAEGIDPHLAEAVQALPACQHLNPFAGLANGGSGGMSAPTTN